MPNSVQSCEGHGHNGYLDMRTLASIPIDKLREVVGMSGKGSEPAGHGKHKEEHGRVKDTGTRLSDNDTPSPACSVGRGGEILDKLP